MIVNLSAIVNVFTVTGARRCPMAKSNLAKKTLPINDVDAVDEEIKE